MMTWQTLVFDLDDTLYPRQSGLMTAVRQRIHTFGQQVTGLPLPEVRRLCTAYLAQYGTALGGLQRHYAIDREAFLAYVHDVPVDRYLSPDAELDQLLGRLPQAKIIFTNSPREHAERVLAALGIGRHFGAIIDVRDCDFVPKPGARPYERLLARLGHAPEGALYVDDRPDNLAPAAALGLATVLLAENGHCPPPVQACIHHLRELEPIVNGHSRNGRPPS